MKIRKLNEALTGYKITIVKEGETFDDYASAYEEAGAIKQMKNKYGNDIEVKNVSVSKVINESKSINEEFTIFINDEEYCDDFGNPHYFTSYDDAEAFIEDNELENAEVVRQYGKANESKSIKEGIQPADKWYLKVNPGDTEGAEELKGLFIDDVIKDKGNLEKYGFSDRLKGILDNQFKRYSPVIAKNVNESIEVATIADYIVDHYDFDDIDDKYSCINSIKDSFKDEKTISKEELEQFIGSHNGKDKVNEWFVGEPDPTGKLEGEARRQAYLNSDKFKEEKQYVIDLAKEARATCSADDGMMSYDEFRAITKDAGFYGNNTLWKIYQDTFNDIEESLTEATHCVYFTQDGIEQIEFEGSEDDCYNYIASIEAEQDDEFGDEAPERYIKRLNEEYEALNKDEWVEYNLSVKKDVKHIIPVKVAEDLGKEFYGWAWGEGYHRYHKSRIVSKIDMTDTDEIIRKYTNEDLNEASYGGAFDIADDQYFTREDLDNFSEEVLNHINETFVTQFDVSACYIDDGVLELEVTNDEYGDYTISEKIDMRKIKEPWHLKREYASWFASELINNITRANDGLIEDLNESITSDAKPIETGVAVGMAAVLSDLIKDEYEAIEGYNSAIATAEAEGYGDMVKVLTDIQAEENIHIGQLQELMKMVDPNAHKIEDGYAEAAEELANPIKDNIVDDDDVLVLVTEDVDCDDDIADEDVEDLIKKIEEAMNAPVVEEDVPTLIDEFEEDEIIVESTEPWEDIYKSFKDIEVQLNGDGEAITATIDRIYQENKDNPDLEKAYQKWASKE